MRRFSLLASILCLTLGLATSGCDDDVSTPVDDPADDVVMFAATPLSGENEVPPNDSDATGAATLQVQGTTVEFSIELHSISEVEAAHIHSGAADVAGPVRVSLFTGPTTGAVDGTLVEGSFTSADVQGITFDQLLEEMRNQTAYVNVHTTTYPDGEVRAQIELVQ